MAANLVKVPNLTVLEAILKAIEMNRRIPPNSAFSGLFRTGQLSNYAGSHHTGTGFAMGKIDTPFGKTIEKEFTYYGHKPKVLVYYVRADDIGKINLMHLFEHQFRPNGESTIQLINAKTNIQILTVEELRDAETIILKVVGEIRNFDLKNRKGGVFESDDTIIHATESPAIGLLERSGHGLSIYDNPRVVGATDTLHFSRMLLLEETASVAEQGDHLQMKQVAEDAIRALHLDERWAYHFEPPEAPGKIIFELKGFFGSGICAELQEKVVPALNAAFQASKVHFKAEPGIGDYDDKTNTTKIDLTQLG